MERERPKKAEEYRRRYEAKQRRLAAEGAAATGAQQPVEQTDELEPGEILSQEEPHGLAVRSKDSSQQTPEVDDVLSSWKPRKEPLSKFSKRIVTQEPAEDEFVGFGHVPASQQDPSAPAKKSEKLPKLNTKTADTSAPGAPNTARILKTPTSAKPPASATSAKQDKPPTVAKSVTPAAVTTGQEIASAATSKSTKPSTAASDSTSVKRPPPPGPSAAGQKRDLGSIKIQKRTSVASPQSPDRVSDGPLTSVGDERPPRWVRCHGHL